MSNNSYLFVSDYDGICPDFVGGIPDLGQTVLAEDRSCVPLLWLAMFRPPDLVTATFQPADPEDDDEDEVKVIAPLAPKDRALAQLQAALDVLDRIFAQEGSLREHAALLRAGVESMPGKFVTINPYEIAVLGGEQEFYDTQRDALASLDEPGDLIVARQRLADLTALRLGRPFPAARLALDDLDAPEDDWWNHSRLLGNSFERPVPWEPTWVHNPA
ncbi:hypothetical protein [Allorhizocola rhizosphaerae]|uniref:hypothetical protein n=1 Tax=Allorhizocola rhizosphaerae TaxID=1872709 RepID=UPI0013C2FC3D|nr:hypothetical protein [Allorhizocola rhizosphaerae]